VLLPPSVGAGVLGWLPRDSASQHWPVRSASGTIASMRRLTAVTLLLVGLVMAGCGGGAQYTASVDSVDPGSAFYTVNWAVTNQASAGLSR